MNNFFNRLNNLAKERSTLLCTGLDPRLPQGTNKQNCKEAIIEANRLLIKKTEAYSLCFKPNSAFYEAWGPQGMEALAESINLVPKDIPVILDFKRSDIFSTAEAYAQAAFDYYNVDAVTLSPYMGIDAVTPFLKYKEKGIFLLCRTSNPGAGFIQDKKLNSNPLYLDLAREMVSWSNQIGLVVAGNDVEALSLLRKELPETWFLSPGIGAQGGKMEEAVSAGCDSDGMGILPVVVRAIANAENPEKAAKDYRDALNQTRENRESIPKQDFLKKRLFASLIKSKCFRVGEFTLKSGKKSPFYIDLRRVISDSKLLDLCAEAYARIIQGLEIDRIAAIPVAALPLGTALSLKTGIPMIFPRIPPKPHGTGNRVEGEYQKGEKVLLLDDLITSGKSKLEALDVLRSEGLQVKELAVLLERGAQGRKDMEKEDISLLAFAHIKELLPSCREAGLINQNEENEMLQYAENE